MPETFTEEDFTGTTTAPAKFSEQDFAEPAKFSEADFSNTPSLQPVFSVTPGQLPPEPTPNRVPLAPVIPEAVANDPNRQAHIAATEGIHSLVQVPRATGNTGFGPWRTMGPVGRAALNIGGGAVEAATDPRYWLLGLLKPAAAIPTAAGLFAPPAVESLGQGIEATRAGDVQSAIEGYGNAALGLGLTAHIAAHPAFGEMPADRIMREVDASPTPLTAGTVATMREAAVAEAPGAMVPVESIPQAVASPIRENGARTSVVLPDGTAVVGGRFHGETVQEAIRLGLATEDQLANGVASFTRPDGTTWDLNGKPVPVKSILNLSEASAGATALPVRGPETVGRNERNAPPTGQPGEGARETGTTTTPNAPTEQSVQASVRQQSESRTGGGEAAQAGPGNSLLGTATEQVTETPQATAGESPAAVAPIAGTPQATARAPIYPEEQGPLQLGIRPGGGTAGTAIHDLFTGFTEKVNDAAQNVRGTVATLAGRSLPRTTLLNREAGEAGVRYGSSNIAAPYVAEDFARRVIADSEVDPRKLGAALTEDNLRSIRQSFADEGKTDQAASVRSLIGAKGSPFKTEAEYQAFLKEPATQAAIERHKQLWSEEVDPIYRKAADLDPDLELASRGLQTGARVNLFADRVGLETSPKDAITFGTGPRLTGTFRRKTPFATKATGAAETYFTNYDDMMANTFGKQMEIANKRIFDDKLVEAGLAVIDKPGRDVTIHNKPAMAFPIRRGPNSLNIYVDPRIANEYRIASNTYTPWLSTGATKKVANAINGMQLAGLVDPVVHISNLGTVLLTRPNVAGGNIFLDSLLSATGRADVGVRLISAAVRGIRETLSGTRTSPAQLRELAEIGALRGKPQGINPGSRLIGWVDQTVRLAMDRTYQRLADDGLLKKSETARREFVNQAGQYNKRLQDFITVFLRSSNLGPFATAGKNFIALGWRNSPLGGFGHGSTATSTASSLALRANVISKWVGSAVFVGAANYLLTGKVAGRPGTPIGRIDTGKSDDNGRPLTIPAFDLLGFGRSLRVTGIRGALDAKRLGLDNPTALDAAYRDMFNAMIAPAMGPVPKTVLSVGNIPSGINVPKPNPVVFPGESQLGSNLANTAYGANTVVAGLREAGALGKLAPWLPYVNQLPPKPGLEVLSRQIPRLTPTPGKPAEMVSKYPEIVLKAKSRDVIEDVIRRARQMDPATRTRYLNQSINKLPEGEQDMAKREMIRRRVMMR